MAAMMAMASLLAALLPALALVTATHHPVHRHTRSWSKPPTQIESGHFPDSP
jgi:hypothetical protein